MPATSKNHIFISPNSKFLQHVKYQSQREQKLSGTQDPGELDKRIQASWKTESTRETENTKNLPSSKEERRENFKKLKEKHKETPKETQRTQRYPTEILTRNIHRYINAKYVETRSLGAPRAGFGPFRPA